MFKNGLFRKIILQLLLTILLGSVFITLANYIPVNQVLKASSLDELASEGLFPNIPSMEGGDGDFSSMEPTALELATDNLFIKMALYEGDGAGIVQAFRDFSTQYNDEYSRYWHGYVVLLRPLLYFFDYYQLRILNGLAQIFLFGCCAFWIWKKKGKKYAFALFTSYVLLMPMATAICFQYSVIFYLAFGALLLYFLKQKYWEQDVNYILLFVLTGSLTTYFDLLTYPLLTWGLLIIWMLLLQESSGTISDNLKKVVYSALAWICGYAVMWAGKWVVGSIVLRENLFQRAFSEAFLWTVSEGDSAITLQDRFQAMYLNWETYSYKLYVLVLFIWLLYAILRGIGGYRKDSRVPAFALIMSSSFVWYFLLAGHTTMHHIFTHKIFGVTIAAFLGIVLVSTQGKFHAVSFKDHKSLLTLLRTYAILLLAGIAAVLLCFSIRSEYSEHNWDYSFTQTAITAPITMAFEPTFSRVESLSLGVSTDGCTTGTLTITISDAAANIIYQSSVAASDWTSSLNSLDVDLLLKAHNTYTITITPQDCDGTVYTWLSDEQDIPLLAETTSLTVNGTQMQQKMLAGVTYWCRPVGKAAFFFWTMSLSGITLAFVALLWNCIIWKQKSKKTV